MQVQRDFQPLRGPLRLAAPLPVNGKTVSALQCSRERI
jgi:hypothetical protein